MIKGEEPESSLCMTLCISIALSPAVQMASITPQNVQMAEES